MAKQGNPHKILKKNFSVDPDQTPHSVHILWCLIWVYTGCIGLSDQFLGSISNSQFCMHF